MTELCQCGHTKETHRGIDNRCLGSGPSIYSCGCRRFTPPVDEREKAVAELSRKWQLREGGGMGPGLRAYHRIYETGANEGFDAGWNARDAEVERLKRALKQILEKKSMGWEVTSEIARRALEEKS